MTVNVCPAIVSVPLRSAPGFGAMPNVTLPSPLPVAPDVTVIQGALLVAVHAHPEPLVTADDPGPPPDAIDCDVAWME